MSESHSDQEAGAEILPVSHAAQHEEGEGNWLVSYADMMTLLVGFFVILLSFSKIDDGKFEQVKRAATAQFGGVYQLPYGEIVERIKAALEKLGMGDQFFIVQNDAGVTISFLGTVFFEFGSTELKSEAQALLAKLIPIIQEESREFDIVIEGHTDDVPIRPDSTLRTNWDLSSLRACRVLEVFEKRGFARSQLTAVGYADARPVVPNRDPAGNPIPANQSQNRRVVIRIMKDSGSLAGAEEAG